MWVLQNQIKYTVKKNLKSVLGSLCSHPQTKGQQLQKAQGSTVSPVKVHQCEWPRSVKTLGNSLGAADAVTLLPTVIAPGIT